MTTAVLALARSVTVLARTGTMPLCLALLACAPGPAPQDPQRGAGPPSGSVGAATRAAALVQDGASIAGQWDVASFDGYQPKRLAGTIRAAFADFRNDGVRLRIECNYSGYAGNVRNGRFVRANDDGAAQTLMSCGPEREARDARYFSFFAKSPTVERVGADRLRLRAGGSELILERPAVRRRQFVPTLAELQGKWRMVELTNYLPDGGYTGGGLSDVPGRILIAGDRVSYTRCPEYGATFRFGTDGRLQRTGGAVPPPTSRDCPALSGPAPGPELPAAWDAVRLLHADPLVERSGEDSLLVSTERLGLLITKAPCESLEQSGNHRSSWVRDCASPE